MHFLRPNARKFPLPSPLTFLSGVLLVLAFPPWGFSPLIWVALIPWFEALERAPTPGAAAVQGLYLSIFMSIGGFHWIAHTLQEFGELPWVVGVLGLLLFSLVGQPQFTLFGPLWKWVRSTQAHRSPFVLWAALALAYTGIDWALPKLFVDTLGHALYNAPRMRQLADVGGATLLTLLIYGFNESAWALARGLRTRREPSIWPALRAYGPAATLSCALCAGAFAYGVVRLKQVDYAIAHPERVVQGAVVQANIGDFDKIASERGINGAANKVLDTFFTLSDQALALSPKPEFLVWPETSYPSTFRTPQTSEDLAHDQAVERYVRSRGVPLLFGGYDHANQKDFNTLFFLAPKPVAGLPGEGDLQIYHKSILLLFGEYIPGAEEFSFLREAFPQVGNFGRGPGPQVLSIPAASGPVPAGPIICYEALFPEYSIGGARKGSRMILNVTNDSWFGPWGEPQLHLALSAFRGIETRLPQLRSTNTGISAFITADGTIAQQTEVDQPQVLSAALPLTAPIWTLMKAWGDWFGPLALFLGVGTIALPWLPQRKTLRQNRHSSKS